MKVWKLIMVDPIPFNLQVWMSFLLQLWGKVEIGTSMQHIPEVAFKFLECIILF